MKLSISQTAKISGVSVRTLHYYDEIGLLSPSEVSETGYRYYDDLALERLQQILFYRELDFPLKEIMDIMNASNYKKEEALQKQKELLLLKRKRLDNLIQLLESNLKGVDTMSFKEFDMDEINQFKEKYAEEVKEKWGNTSAYQESNEKTKNYSKEDWNKALNKSDQIMKEFAKQVGKDPAEEEVQKLVSEWKAFITEAYYNCTDEILAGLGQMYLADQRFKDNIDKFGAGTAELMSKAIAVYCEK
jgi:Predicted transcriptional regulators